MKTALTIYRNGTKSYDRTVQVFELNGATFKTLWVPVESGNRTAAINLNHEIDDFIGCDILMGANGNCATRYAILPIPAHWEEPFTGTPADETCEVMTLAKALCARLGKTSGYRVLKADIRLVEIIREIVRMAGAEWSSAIYGDVDAIDLVSGEEKLESLRPVNQQMVREVIRTHKPTGLLYVTKSDADRLRKALHRYPKGHQFAGQFIGLTYWMEGRLERSSNGTVQMTSRVASPRNIEQATIAFYDVHNNDKHVVALVGNVTKAIAELDRAIAAEDARLRDMLEQTFVRGVKVERIGHTPQVVHSREAILDLLPKWGLAWNAPSQRYMDNFLTNPLPSCKMLLPNSGPVPTILTRL